MPSSAARAALRADGERPGAEWGFEPALREELRAADAAIRREIEDEPPFARTQARLRAP